MREKGLEPSRLYRHKILSLACLPIPAFPQAIRFSNQGDNQIWTGDQGVADPRLTAWLCRRCPVFRTTPWTGLEPVTLRLTAACSTYWAIRAKYLNNITNSYWICKYFFLNSNLLCSFLLRNKGNTMNLIRKFKYAIFLSSYFARLVLTKKNMCLQNWLPIPELYKFSYLLVKPSTY